MKNYDALSSLHLPFGGLEMNSADAIRQGLPASLVAEVAKQLWLQRSGLCAYLQFNDASICNRAEIGEMLSSWETGRLYYVYKVFDRAFHFFRDEYAAIHWMGAKIIGLGCVEPLSLLDTPAGFELVLATLGNIEFDFLSLR